MTGSLTGIVVCGGRSSRMGTDKSLLEYYGIQHRYFVYDLLKTFCNNVYLSVNKSQTENISCSYNYIQDESEFENSGPVCALLSVWKRFPGTSLLAAGCDYPFMNKNVITELVNNRKAIATCFLNSESNILEPLLTIYEPDFFHIIRDNYSRNNFSLSKMLEHENVNVIETSQDLIFENVNTTDEYSEAKKLILSQTLAQ